MKVVSVNALSNLHLLRDYYHRPVLRKVGKKRGVQASTVRSRYTDFCWYEHISNPVIVGSY